MIIFTLTAHVFTCGDGTEIDQHKVCDGNNDCPVGQDEKDCDGISSYSKCYHKMKLFITGVSKTFIKIYMCVTILSGDRFFCNDGKEINESQVCDGERNCMGGEDEDEAMCSGTGSGGSGCKYFYDKSIDI